MSAPESYQLLQGSDHHPPAGSRQLGPVDSGERLSITVLVRRRTDGEPLPAAETATSEFLTPSQPLSAQSFTDRYGADQGDVDRVTAFLTGHGLHIDDVNLAARMIMASGTAAQVESAFQVELHRYEHPPMTDRTGTTQSYEFRGHDGFTSIPTSLTGVITGVFGLDNRWVTKRHNSGDPPNTTTTTVPEVVRLYGWPTSSAAGQTIGIFSAVASGSGGYNGSDIQQYFSALPASYQMPKIIDVSADGSANNPDAPDGETTQDICIAASVAQGAVIAVYFNAGDENGWVRAINRAVHPQGTDPKPAVFSTSFYISNGDDQPTLTKEGITSAFVEAVQNVLADAAQRGVTFCIASGDAGTASRLNDGKAHVPFPEGDPWVLCCGGTTVGNIRGESFDEYVWNDEMTIPATPPVTVDGATGGGVSDMFALPAYQQQAGVPKSVNDGHVGRGIPDVAANASYNSGYYPVYCRGNNPNPFAGNGTSASAPLYAGLVAVLCASLGRPLGFINPTLYSLGSLRSSVFRGIVGPPGPANNGFNGVPGYPAGSGWNACTGWGVATAELLPQLRAKLQGATPTISSAGSRSYS